MSKLTIPAVCAVWRSPEGGYSVSPVYLYNPAGQLVFWSRNSSYKVSSNFGALLSKPQEASLMFDVCAF